MADDSFPGWQAEKTVRLVTRAGMTQVFVKGRLYMSWRYGDELGQAISLATQEGYSLEELGLTLFYPVCLRPEQAAGRSS